jgi:hypothetical protein
MRIADFVITAAVVAGMSGTALAQNSSSAQPVAPDTAATSSTTLAQTPLSAELVAVGVVKTSGQAFAQAPAATPVSPSSSAPYSDHWFASAYLGTNFGSGGGTELLDNNGVEIDNNNGGSTTSVNFGGEVGYVWSGIGAEFMANYAPNFELSNALLDRRPKVSSYMFNGIYAIPVGTEHTFRPFVSGGVGSVHISADIFTIDPTTVLNIATLGTERVSGNRFGWDVGGGLMAFNGPWGLRGDLRYFKATSDNTVVIGETIGDQFLREGLGGLSYWNFNFGVAFRW